MSPQEYMQLAIDTAKQSQEKGGLGFGAVIVKDFEVISIGHDSVGLLNDPTAHGEIMAIREACKKLNTFDLTGCTLYSTCEPCPMCFTAWWWAQGKNLVYGVSLEDVTNLSDEIILHCKDINDKAERMIEIEGGFMKQECLRLYKRMNNRIL